MEDGADQWAEGWDAADDEDDPLFADGGQDETRDEECYVIGVAEGSKLGGFDGLGKWLAWCLSGDLDRQGRGYYLNKRLQGYQNRVGSKGQSSCVVSSAISR